MITGKSNKMSMIMKLINMTLIIITATTIIMTVTGKKRTL